MLSDLPELKPALTVETPRARLARRVVAPEGKCIVRERLSKRENDIMNVSIPKGKERAARMPSHPSRERKGGWISDPYIIVSQGGNLCREWLDMPFAKRVWERLDESRE